MNSKHNILTFYLFTPFCSNQWTVFVFEFLSFYSTVYLAVRFVLLSVVHVSIYVLVSSSLFPFTQALNFGRVGRARQLYGNFFLTTLGQMQNRGYVLLIFFISTIIMIFEINIEVNLPVGIYLLLILSNDISITLWILRH